MKNLTFKKLGGMIAADFIDAFFIAISITSFALNANFAPGGVNGIGVILNHVAGLPVGIISLILNIPIVIVSYRLLGKLFLINSLKTMVICALVMDLTAPFLPKYTGDPLMAAIFSGIFGGIGYGLIFLEGSSTGGSDFLIMSMKKLSPHMSIGQITQIIDGSVIIVAGFIFKDVNAVLYGIINTIVTSIIIDRVMTGTNSGKLTLIITEKGKIIAQAIDNNTGRGSTLLKVSGGYKGDEKDMVLCVCSNKQVVPIRRIVKETDENAFMIVSESKEVFGEGFQNLE